MDINLEEFKTMSEMLNRYSIQYGTEYHFVPNKCASIKVRYGDHELMISYVYGNSRIFIIDEWNPMETLKTSNIASLPERITSIVDDWKERVKEAV